MWWWGVLVVFDATPVSGRRRRGRPGPSRRSQLSTAVDGRQKLVEKREKDEKQRSKKLETDAAVKHEKKQTPPSLSQPQRLSLGGWNIFGRKTRKTITFYRIFIGFYRVGSGDF